MLKSTTERNEWFNLCCILVFSVVALLTALWFGRHLSKLIIDSVGEMLAFAERLSRGDVNSDITIEARGEIGQLALAHNKMIAFIRTQAQTIQAIAYGDYTCKIEPRDDIDIMSHSIAKLLSQNGELLNAVQKVSKQIYAISSQV